MSLFGSRKTKQQPKTTPQDAIKRLNETLDNIDKREKHIQKNVDKELATAKQMIAAKNKNGAKMALRRKKMYESQIEKLNGTKMTIENQKMALENANFNKDIMQAMSMGAQALRGVNQDLTIDSVDQTMDDIQEQMDLANEISEAISQPTGAYVEDDELEAELAELEAEGLDETLLSVESTPKTALPKAAVSGKSPELNLPSAPTSQVTVDEDEQELRALEASMA
eukprot:c4855_g1_i1.p1 GENE.c4855_g1_i1~~c4855_g1_i1.p1  ORF type:complete len:238 (-),score=95.00 c4855_g1_i1:94-768(-)